MLLSLEYRLSSSVNAYYVTTWHRAHCFYHLLYVVELWSGLVMIWLHLDDTLEHDSSSTPVLI